MKSGTIYTRYGELAVWIGFLGTFVFILLSVFFRQDLLDHQDVFAFSEEKQK